MHRIRSDVKSETRIRAVAPFSLQSHRGAMDDDEARRRSDQRKREEIGGRMARARVGSGFANVTKFAQLVGVDRNTVGRWERGENAPDALALDDFARVTRVSIDWIVRGEIAESARVVLDAFVRKHGERAEKARTFLESLRLDGYVPTEQFYELVLIAYERGLEPDDATRVSRVTVSAKAI